MERIAVATTHRIVRAALACAAILLCSCESATAPEPPIPEPPIPAPRAVVLEAATPTELAGVVGTQLAATPEVRVSYEDGTAAAGVEVWFAASDGGVVGRVTAMTDSHGRASAGAWRLGRRAGRQTLTARTSAGSVTFTADVSPGAVAVLIAAAGSAQTAAPGATLSQPLRVRAQDGFGNPVTGAAVAFVVVEGGGVIDDDIVVTGVDGEATSGSWTLGPVSGRQRVLAQSGQALIVFSANACDPCAWWLAYVLGSDIVTVAEHTGQVQALTTTGVNRSPSWSPDGSRIAFTRYAANVQFADVWIMNADGTGQTQVTSGNVSHSPSWSPQGDALAFAGDWWACVYECAIYVQELAAGSAPRLVARMAADPAWSPDGRRIAFVALSGDDGYHSLRLIQPDGSNVVEVTPIDEGVINGPAWSPDGTLLAFSKCVVGGCDIHIVRPDGSDLIRLTNVGNALSPAWSADGTRIAFTLYSAGVEAIAWVPAAGGEVTPLVAAGHSPAWRP